MPRQELAIAGCTNSPYIWAMKSQREIADFLYGVRRNLNLPQDAFAEVLGVTQSWLSRIERGRTRPEPERSKTKKRKGQKLRTRAPEEPGCIPKANVIFNLAEAYADDPAIRERVMDFLFYPAPKRDS